MTKLGVDGVTDRFDYDGAGNMTGRGCYILAAWPAPWVCRQGLAYDAEGRLSTLSDGNLGSESYQYDGDGVLVKRSTPASAAAIQFTEHYTATSSAWTTTAASTWGQPTPDGHATTLKTVGAGNWTTTVARTATVAHGQTARVAFKLSQTSSQAVLALDTGSGSTYHRFGVYENGGKLYQAVAASTSGGTSYVNPTVLVDGFAAGVWYILELTVDDGAGDRVSVWRADTPGVRYEARWEAPSGQVWTFRHWAYAGTTWLDDYQELRPAQAGFDARIVGKHYEYDSVSNTQTKRYYAQGKLLATRSIPNANPSAQTLRYIQPDHLGSTTTLTDNNGVVVSRERYAAFGERRRSSDKVITDQLYTGQRLNVLSNLYHYSDGGSAGRFYDPLLARFVQADSVTPGNTSIALNRYAYANNSPVRYNDPNGQMSIDMADGSGGLGAGAMWAVGIGGGLALRAWVIGQIANALPTATANVDKVPGIIHGIEQNSENARRAAEASDEAEAGGADPNDPRRGGRSSGTEGLDKALKPVTDVASKTSTAPVEAAKDAYEIAKAGGRHAKLLKWAEQLNVAQIEKSIRSLEQRASEHLRWAADPLSHPKYGANWPNLSPEDQQRNIQYWQKEAQNYQDQATVLRGMLEHMAGGE